MQWTCGFAASQKRLIDLGLSMVLVALLGCVAPEGDRKMQVEVDVFSGRLNPHWELTAQESNEFVQRFQSLSPSSGEGAVKEGLGYRGLIVSAPEKEIEGFQEILVSNGLVVARRDSQSQQFVDRNRVLEKWLFQTGKGRLDNELYRQISGSIE
jgi:hypothetical protein